MAGKKPFKANTKKDDSTSFPSLQKMQQTQQPGEAKTSYEDRQKDELTVLAAIYDGDFVLHKAAHSVWKKSEPSFDIRIKAPSDEDCAVTLGVVLTATYPKSVPVLTLKDHDLREATLFKIQTNILEAEAKKYAARETEMIDQLVEGIRDILEEAAIAKAQGLELPSLEEERAAHERKLAQEARNEKEEEDRKRKEETLEEERALGALVEQERERQRTKAKEVRKKNKGHNGGNASPNRGTGLDDPDTMVFDDQCDLTDTSGNPVYFKTVTGRFLFHTGPISKVYVVRPVLSSDQEQISLALKQSELKCSSKDSVQVLKQIQSLETNLNVLKKLRRQKLHRNILDVIDFRIDRTTVVQNETVSSPPPPSHQSHKSGRHGHSHGQQPNMSQQPQELTTWTVSVLSLMADKGSLEDFLELAGHLEVTKVRAWTRDLLDALEYLHSHGVLHEDIHPSNVLLVRDGSGDIVPKLADACYQRLMHNISSRSGPKVTSMRTARSAYWLPPEIAGTSRPQYTQKTDVWDLGVIFLQMIFGLDVPQKYHSPREMMDSQELSKPLYELVSKLFTLDPKRRPRAFDLGSSEFLATDAPILAKDTLIGNESVTSLPQSLTLRSRRDSANHGVASRYREDFIEEGRLGKGGFGEVVKARKKLDGQIYAIKKITIIQSSQDSLTITDILTEVRLLSQLSHPAVVRYYNAWLEDIHDFSSSDAGDTSTEGYNDIESQPMSDINIEFTNTKSGGLDFMSSGGYPNITFEYSDDDDDEDSGEDSDEDSDDDDDNNNDGNQECDENSDYSTSNDNHSDATATNDNRPGAALDWGQRRRPSQRPVRKIMYISMEYCEKRSLRDLITRNLSKDTQEVWRLFRQLLEGLAHIHGLGIVHRDLKPDNVFIAAGADGVNNVKIGDFGLATTGQLAGADRGIMSSNVDAHDETRSIGTSVYVAPEVRSGGGGSYTTKVDMYSLGVIFFEMCYPPMIGMQRADVLTKLRGSPPVLPSDFKPKEKSQVDIIKSLLTHNPKERPSGAELLKSGKLPVQMESETIRHALAELANPASPYYQKMLSLLFAQPVEQAKDYAWDMSATQTQPTAQDLMRQHIVKEILVAVFRRHGAVEATRTSLYPRSSLYSGANIMQLLDRFGNLLQLPFDLTMGNARSLARCSIGRAVVAKSYTFGSIFRDKGGGGQPSMFGEVDFDLVTTHTLDLALREAEVIKVIDEITASFPVLRNSPLCFQMGHSDLLQLIFDFCGVERTARRAVADVLSRLNIHTMTWQRLRGELRSQGASSTSIDELQKFDFRDTPSKAFSKLKTLFEGTDMYERASSTLAHLREVYEYCKRMGVGSKIYVSPLNTWNEAFFAGGIMFSCLLDKKVKDVFAAGGRYDGLIKEYRPRFGSNPPDERHAVGFSLNWEKLAQPPPRSSGKAFLKKAAEEDTQGAFSARRCDVLVASFDPTILRSAGIELLRALWANDISAELAGDARSTEELVSRNRDEGHGWVVIIKQDSMVKIRTMPSTPGSGAGGSGGGPAAHKKDAPDVDMPLSQVITWLRGEIPTRTGFAGKVAGSSSSLDVSALGGSGHHHSSNDRDGYDSQQQDVRVLVSQTKSKKFNRQAVVEQAQVNAARLVKSFLAGPIAAVETTDQVIDLIRGTSLSDADSWRRVEQSVSTAEKKYTREIQGMLAEWRTSYEAGSGSRHAFVYNFRTGNCIYYDLGA